MNGYHVTPWSSMAIKSLQTFDNQQRNHPKWFKAAGIVDALKEQRSLH